jgi:uncharacterized membrane protein
MKRAVLIASAVAAVLAAPAFAADWGNESSIDEKCYGVSAKDFALCGAQDCASQTSGAAAKANGQDHPEQALKGMTPDGETFAFVPQGTCSRMYGGSLTPKGANKS